MRTRYAQFLTALHNAQGFLSANDAALGEISTSGAKAVLDKVTETIASLAVAQGSHRMEFGGARSTEVSLARTLRHRHLLPLTRIVRASLPDVPRADYAIPPASGNSTALVNFTGSLLRTVEPYTAVLVAAGFPADFAERAQSAADSLSKAIIGKGAQRTKRVTATFGLDKHVAEARRAVKTLDAIVTTHLDENDPVLRGWRDARRTIQGGGSAASPLVDATPQVASVITSAPATPPVPASEAPGAKAA